MSLSSIGDGVFTTGGGVLCKRVVYNGSNSSLSGETSFGPAFFITRADKLLRVLPYAYGTLLIYYSFGHFITRADIVSRVLLPVRLRLPSVCGSPILIRLNAM